MKKHATDVYNPQIVHVDFGSKCRCVYDIRGRWKRKNYILNGTRKLAFPHFALPAFTWIVTVFLYDELRKIFVRRGTVVGSDGHTKLKGWVAQNTLY